MQLTKGNAPVSQHEPSVFMPASKQRRLNNLRQTDYARPPFRPASPLTKARLAALQTRLRQGSIRLAPRRESVN